MNGIREVSDGLDDVVAAPRCNVYAAVQDFLRASDRPPTVRDVHYAVELKFSYWMKVLRPEGWERSHGNPALHMEADDLPREVGLPSQIGATVMVPVYGWIPGGPLDLPNQAFEGAFLLDKPAFGAGTLFMFQVVGNSMIKAGIADGNWVVVRQQEVARDGDIVAAMVGGEVTVKTLHRERGLLELVPQNPDYEPISVTELTILGKVVGVVRQT